MRTPHTHYTKGKTVWVRLRAGDEIVGRFVERKGKYVILDNAKIEMKAVAAMSYRKHKRGWTGGAKTEAIAVFSDGGEKAQPEE